MKFIRSRAALAFVLLLSLCIFPLFLNFLGFDFSALFGGIECQKLGGVVGVEQLHRSLRGHTIHCIMEWSAVCLALLTAVLAFFHFATERDIVSPVICLALFSAGLVDAFHILAASSLVDSVADNRQFIPFTWAISRLFNVGVRILGVVLLLWLVSRRIGSKERALPVLLCCGALFGSLAVAVVAWCANSPTLPQTMYPNGLVTRPFDIIPLLLFAFAGLVLYPALHKRSRSLFTFALILSTVPEIATQLYMAFGSTQLYDNHFNIGHGLKILAYFVPFAGLALSYVEIQRKKDRALHEIQSARELLGEVPEAPSRVDLVAIDGVSPLEQAIQERLDAEARLVEYSQEVERSNRELESFAYVASHDLRAPLRGIKNLASWLHEDLGGTLPSESQVHLEKMQMQVERMERLLDDLLMYSRVGKGEESPSEIDLPDLLRECFQMNDPPPEFQLELSEDLPASLYARRAPLHQVLLNLLGNAIKHHDRADGRVRVSAFDEGGSYRLIVEDDGPGIAEKYHEKIFEMFQSLGLNGKGSGMGLALVKKIVELEGGGLELQSAPGKGSCFVIVWPRDARMRIHYGGSTCPRE